MTESIKRWCARFLLFLSRYTALTMSSECTFRTMTSEVFRNETRYMTIIPSVIMKAKRTKYACE